MRAADLKLIISRNVVVDLFVLFVSLDEYTLNQVFNPLLDLEGVRHEPLLKQLGRLNHQCLVVESLARLHHLHDAGVDSEATIILHFRLSAGAVLLLGLLAD